MLRRALWRSGCRYRVNVRELPGCPDIVLSKPRVAVFCDGDFWHGRNWNVRSKKLQAGHNARYWTSKIEGDMARDNAATARLEAIGWTVLRFWETDILKFPDLVTKSVLKALARARVGRRR